jgi:hypothetical protein
MRRATRRNRAAYQHRRRRSLTGGHADITRGRRMEYHRSHSRFLTHQIAGSHGPIALRCPGYGRFPAHERAVNSRKRSKNSFAAAEANRPIECEV